jgi:hypothetical protein
MGQNKAINPENIPQNMAKKYVCELCDYNTRNKTNFNTHNLTRKHIVKQNEAINLENTPKNTAKKYVCELCDYNTINKKDFNKHNLTRKHITKQNEGINTVFLCNCGLNFNNRSSLSEHKNKCSQPINYPPNTNLITPELVIEMLTNNKELLNDNKEMKQILIQQTNTINELVKNGTNNTINNSNSNNTFNLNFFLNETCKNAINMPDFINSIQLTFHDLMEMGELGYVGAITKIVTSKLNELGVTQRPIHCTDKKRDTLHIKENGKWEKDDDKIKMRKVIGNVSNKYVKLLPDYQKSHPDCHNSDSKTSEKYHKSVIAVMDGDHDNKDKIINNISKVVTVEKKQYVTATDTEMID